MKYLALFFLGGFVRCGVIVDRCGSFQVLVTTNCEEGFWVENDMDGCDIVILLTADNSFLFFKAKEVEL